MVGDPLGGREYAGCIGRLHVRRDWCRTPTAILAAAGAAVGGGEFGVAALLLGPCLLIKTQKPTCGGLKEAAL